MTQTVRAVIVGQGYVGLPLALAAAAAGHDVTGVDTSEDLVERLAAGDSPIGDVPSAALQAALDSGRYSPTSTFTPCGHADVVILCVPTPYTDEAPDLSFLQTAATNVAANLSPGTLVILESTTFPGTTEDVLCPLLEQGSGLVAGVDFDLAFSPERIDPGNPAFGLANTPKIVGGLTTEATRRAAAFYRSFVDEVVEVSEPKTAEMAKLLENTFRHINIALVNELAILCQDLGVDIWEVIDAAASKPFGFMAFYPGPGVGGHCIPVDPMYLSWRVRQFGAAAKFIELARDVNDGMPLYCAQRVAELLNDVEKPVKGSRILVLGVTYKPDVADLRETPAKAFIQRLLQRGAQIDYHDPFAPEFSVTDDVVLRSVTPTQQRLEAADCVVVLTAHRDLDYDAITDHARLVFDARNAIGGNHKHVHRL